MGEENTLVLHGIWASGFVKRVEIALKIKGVSYEYVEEDLKNKSPALLKYNPVYKKVPVLVHNGKPIAESLVILEYINEVWKNGPHLLPEDPYKRAQIRFWADFAEKQVFECTFSILLKEGEEQEKACGELKEKLKLLEDGLKGLIAEGSRFVNGDELGFLDIVMFSVLGVVYDIYEQVLGIKFIDKEEFPGIFSWLTNINEHPIIVETLPPREKIVGLLQFVRQNALKSAAV